MAILRGEDQTRHKATGVLLLLYVVVFATVLSIFWINYVESLLAVFRTPL